MATYTLPEGSTSSDLQGLISGLGPDDEVLLSSDMNFYSAVSIPEGMTLTLSSTDGNVWALNPLVSGFRHFQIAGELILSNLIVNGNATAYTGVTMGGIAVSASGVFTMTDGTIIQNCAAQLGGGVLVTGGTMHMEGGIVQNNFADDGGGIYLTTDATILMTGGSIRGNSAETGGGIQLVSGSSGTMTGGIIGGTNTSDANVVLSYGGGVMLDESSFILNGGSIDGNRMESTVGGGGGGGVFLVNNSIFQLVSGTVNNNFAGAGTSFPTNGGGIMLGSLSFVTPPAPSTLYITGGTIAGNEVQYRGGGVGAVANCNIIMTGGTISGNIATTSDGGGGGVYIGNVISSEGVSFTMSGGSITGNEGYVGGGVLIYSETFTADYTATFLMHSGVISNNTSTNYYGGGVCVLLSNSIFQMVSQPTSGLPAPMITGNHANTDGGGIFAYITEIFISGSMVTDNSANSYGGGIRLSSGSTCIIEDGTVSDNTAGIDGGGIYLGTTDTLEVLGASFIIGNDASNGNGGGIFTADYNYANPASLTAYSNITTAATVVFDENHASVAYTPPDNAADFTNIGYATTSIVVSGGYVHPLNNYDINYVGPVPLILYSVTYDANGGTGSHVDENIESGTIYHVLAPEDAGISRPGYTFVGWNTAADGSGMFYEPGDTITITGDVTLYAQWTPVPGPYDVIYDANGGTGSHADTGIPADTQYTVLSPEETGISRPGFTFTGWNTAPDGSGTAYQPGDTILITGDVVLYAQWTQVEEFYSVTYDPNGGTSSHVDANLPGGTIYTVLSQEETGITRPGFTFTGWNTAPDGSGTAYQPGDTILITGDVVLYAQWTQNQEQCFICVPCCCVCANPCVQRRCE